LASWAHFEGTADASCTADALLTGSVGSLPPRPLVLVPSDRALLGLERQPAMHTPFARAFRAFLANVDAQFDVCVIDTNPNPDIRLIAALASADFVLSPIQLTRRPWTVYDRVGVRKIKAVLNSKLQLIGLLPTMVEPTPFQKATANHLLRAPARVDGTEPVAKPRPRCVDRQAVVDQDAHQRRSPTARQFKAHAVVRDDQEFRRSDRLPDLHRGDLALGDDFIQRKPNAQHAALHANFRSDHPTTAGIDIDRHARAQHHHGRLTHVRSQCLRIVQKGEHLLDRRIGQSGAFVVEGKRLIRHYVRSVCACCAFPGTGDAVTGSGAASRPDAEGTAALPG